MIINNRRVISSVHGKGNKTSHKNTFKANCLLI